MTTMDDKVGSAPTTPVWLVRAGRQGEDEAAALEHGLAIIGFREFPDLASAADSDDLLAKVRHIFPEAQDNRIRNLTGQLAAFVLRIREGDIVALPLKTRPGRVALGRVTGSYRFREVDGVTRHTRSVDWVRPDVPRSDIQQDLLYSLGAFMTVCRIRRNDAEHRIAAILAGGHDPGTETSGPDSGATVVDADSAIDGQTIPNIALIAHDQVLNHVRSQFPDHHLARLVEAVLQAEGYTTGLSPPGPDGGVDILAGRGPLGFEGPRICVQVKATTSTIDVTVLRGLQGTMQTFRADQGLLRELGRIHPRARTRGEARLLHGTALGCQ